MKFIIAPDSFKESMSAITAAEAMQRGIKKALPNAETVLFPMADGGEGTIETILYYSKCYKRLNYTVMGPLDKAVDATIGYCKKTETVVIEMAQTSGLMLVAPGDRNPLYTSTFGLGELVKKALELSPKKIIMGIGGSATNDGGVGFLQALGVLFFNCENKQIGLGGGSLNTISSIDVSGLDSRLNHIEITVLSDVTNPLLGPRGCTRIFGPQKGASSTIIETLEIGMQRFADVYERVLGKRLRDLPGSGAAGGLGMALYSLPNVKQVSGIDYIAELSNVDSAIKSCTAVFTGEGSIDEQSLQGKVPAGIAAIANKYRRPVYAMVGKINCPLSILKELGMTDVFPISSDSVDLLHTLKQGAENIEKKIATVAKQLFSGEGF